MNTATKKHRRGEETKKRLIQSTKLLLNDYDYKNITLDQISKDVNVSKSSIVWHFGSKEGLLVEAVFDLFEEIDNRFSKMGNAPNTLRERILFLLNVVGNYFETNPMAKGIAISLLLNNQVPTEIHERISQQWSAHTQEIIRFLQIDDSDEGLNAARGIISFIHGFYLQWFSQKCQGNMAEQMINAFDAMTYIAEEKK